MDDRELLVRIDERVGHLTEEHIPSIKRHLASINDKIVNHEGRIITSEVRWAMVVRAIKITGIVGGSGGSISILLKVLGVY